jgi:polyferredoxin
VLNPTIVLAAIAGGMIVVTALAIRWAAQARTPLRAGIVVFLLLMMAAMLGGAAIYFARPSAASLIEGFWVASALMSVSAFAVFAGHAREARVRLEKGDGSAPPALRHVPRFVAIVIVLVLANELLMGWTFSQASGAGIVASGSGVAALVSLAVGVVLSPWFLFTMAAEMILTAYWLRALLPRPFVIVAMLQGVIMALSPPALASGNWVAISVYGSSAVMIALFVYVMEYLYRNRSLPAPFATYLLLLLGVYAAMMAGLFLWQYYGTGALFALSVVGEMGLFYEAVVRPERGASRPPLQWQLRPSWAFGVLALVFVAELFMGAVLDVQAQPATYLGGFPFLPLSGPAATVGLNAVQNGFWFIATVTASTWFLVMMGIEMGALVAFKMRESQDRENRYRMALMLGSYAAFAVFYPSIYYGLVFPNALSGTEVPVLGWSMGIGSAPLAVTVFGILLVTYAATGILTFLFGRRVVCSVFCTAPLMYQGTTVDAMKSFNRSSPIGRKYLSSRLSNVYTATMGAVMASLVVASVFSYLDTTGAANVYVAGSVDPTVFLFTLYFGVLWYVLFVTIPYTGNYNCVTMGWCYTGTVAAAFQKLGPYKLKVRDKGVCRSCTTLDCAKACPVGLTDMPGHFRRSGQFRSTKCCGVGNCVEVCPYGNLYIYDIRHWIRDRLGRPERPAARRSLPMVRARAPGVTASVAPALAPTASAAGGPAGTGAVVRPHASPPS